MIGKPPRRSGRRPNGGGCTARMNAAVNGRHYEIGRQIVQQARSFRNCVPHPHHFLQLSGFAIMMVRGVRGATTADSNDRDSILTASRQLLAMMVRLNGIYSEDVASATFTVTKDLDAEFPALAARQLQWLDVPLLCGYEISVPGSLQKCIRILIHWNTDTPQDQIQHVYIKEAVRLRPDLSDLPPVDFDELEQWINEHMEGLQ